MHMQLKVTATARSLPWLYLHWYPSNHSFRTLATSSAVKYR